MTGMGFRTMKTAVGAGLAIWIADLAQLQFSTFAAIIVIMCIEKTKKRSLAAIMDKLFACLLALLLGGGFLELFGYYPIVFSIFILLFVPLLVRAKIQGGFVTSMVVFLHLYALENVTLSIMLNEFYIILIGIGIAAMLNSYMPSVREHIRNYRKEIEQRFSTILYEFSAYLRNPERNWDGKEVIEVEDIITEAKNTALKDSENHLIRKQYEDLFYLEMRENQLDLLRRMLPVVSSLGIRVKQKEIFAEFLEFLSQHVHSGDTTELSLQKLDECWKLIRETDLPQTREEFETRAGLFYLMNEIENYLHIKRKLFNKAVS